MHSLPKLMWTLSTFYFSVCQITELEKFLLFSLVLTSNFSALKCLSELLLETFKKLESIFAMFISLMQTLF